MMRNIYKKPLKRKIMTTNNTISGKPHVISVVALIVGILIAATSLLVAFIASSLEGIISRSTLATAFAACELALVATSLALLLAAVLKSRNSNMLLTTTTLVAIPALLAYILLEALKINGFSPAIFIFCGVIVAIAAAVFLLVSCAKTARRKALLAVAFSSFVIEAVIGAALRVNGGLAYSILIVSVLYLLFTMFCMTKYAAPLGSKSLLAAMLIGWGILVVPDHIYGSFTVDFPAALWPYADTLCHLLGILAGFVWYKARTRWVGWSVCCVMVLLAVFMFAKGLTMWLELWGRTS
jgi:hypothetical protein